jgi:aconitate hydratase
MTLALGPARVHDARTTGPDDRVTGSSTPPSWSSPSTPDLPERVAWGRRRLGRPLTLAEKVLVNHLRDPRANRTRARAQLRRLRPRPGGPAGRPGADRGPAVHDGRPGRGGRADHRPLRPPHPGQGRRAASDLQSALGANAEVYDFSAVCAKYGIGFWKPGSGIIHQVVLENYAFPAG